MHQTVREFFLRPNGYVTKSKFSMNNDHDSHLRISITCIRYLMLCAAKSLQNEPPNIESWDSEHFEVYARYINERPFINYALSHLKTHMDGCRQNPNISHFVLQLAERLISSPAFFLLESWVSSNLNWTQTTSYEQSRAADNFRNQTLHAAIRMRFPVVAEALLRAGAQVEARLQGKTPLIVSAERGDDMTIRLLIDWDADKDAKDSNGGTALHHAASNGRGSTIRMLVETLGADDEAKNNNGEMALHCASSNGHDSTVRMFVETLGADKEAKTSKGETALHSAAWNGHDSTIRMLVETLGADREAKNNNGKTALHCAASNGHDSTVRMLVDPLGADKEAKNNNGGTALHYAASNGHDSTVRMLVETLGVDKEAKDSQGQTALHFAAVHCHESTVQLLANELDANR